LIENTFDIDIHYYARVDFKAFGEIINEVGGVTVNVERSFTDASYPAQNDTYQVVSFTQGIQTMDGDSALKYARSRHGNNAEGSDFARAKRQQKVLLALKEKVLSVRTLANPVRIYNIIKSLDKHLTTNMAFSDIIALLKMGRELDTNNINTVILDNSSDGYLRNGYSPNGAFILEPTAGNFDEINARIDAIFDETSDITKNDTPTQETKDPEADIVTIEIQNGTWRAGLAARVRERLRKQHYTIAEIGNTEERPQMTSGIYSLSDEPLSGVPEALKNELSIPIKKISESVRPSTSTDILIILGEDFEE
jgi:anionic cell wall polymer biosynthesis LytR-Cps2A-Psr (LCP) family protein